MATQCKELVLLDAGTMGAFARAGQADALFGWYGGRLRAVRDVLPELDGADAGCAARLERERLLLELSAAGKVWVARVEDALGGGPGRIASIASARMALELGTAGDAATVVARGRWAQTLCARLHVGVTPADELVRAMSGAGALPEGAAERVARAL